MFVAHAVGTASISLVLAFAPPVQQQLGLSPSSFGLAVACYYAAQTIAALPAGWLVDRFGIRAGLLASHVLLAAGMAQVAVSGGAVGLSVGLAICGLGYALINPATARGVLSWFDSRHRATAMGVKQTGVPIGAVAIAMMAGALADRWQSLAIAIALSTVLTAFLFLSLKGSNRTGQNRHPLRDMQRALSNRRLIVLNLGGCLYNMAFGCVLTYLVMYAFSEVGASAGEAALLLAIIQGVSALARILWGVVGDALPGNGRVIGLVACGAFGAIGVFGIPLATSIGHLEMLAILLGMTLGGFGSLAQTHAVESVEPGLAGAAVGFNSLLLTAGMMFGPALFAIILETGGYQTAFSTAAIVLLVGAVLFFSSGLRAIGIRNKKESTNHAG
jgi:MFS family permease